MASQAVGATYAPLGAYVKPGWGVPKSNLTAGFQSSLTSAVSAYQKPGTSVPKSDLETSVQTSLTRADGSAQLTGAQTVAGKKTFTDGIRSTTVFGLGPGDGSPRMPHYENLLIDGSNIGTR